MAKVKNDVCVVIVTGPAASYATNNTQVAKTIGMKNTEQAVKAVVGSKYTLVECENAELNVTTYKVGVKGESTAVVISLKSS